MPTPANASTLYKDQIREIANSSGITLTTAAPGTTNLNTVLRLLGDKTDVSASGTYSPNLGDFIFSTGMTSFASETYQNFICAFGYNHSVAGQVNANEPSLGINFESNYYAGSEGRPIQTSELYFQLINVENTSAARVMFFQVANNEADIATYGYVITSHIYAGGIEGANGLNVIGSKAGSNDASLALASIRKNVYAHNYVTGGVAAAAFAIKTETDRQFSLWSGGVDTGAFMTFTSVAGQGSMLALGAKQGANVSFPRYPLLGVDMKNVTGTYPGFSLKSKSGSPSNLIEYVKHDNTLMWAMDENGVWDIDGSLFTGTPADTSTAFDWLPIKKDGATVWLKVYQ